LIPISGGEEGQEVEGGKLAGATREIGSALTRMCMRHRSIEAKLRHFTNSSLFVLIISIFFLFPLSLTLYATAVIITHPLHSSISLPSVYSTPFSSHGLQTVLLPHAGRGNLRPQLDSAMQDVSDLYLLMEETEKQAVRRALLEERGRYCTFINFLQPVVVSNIYVLKNQFELSSYLSQLSFDLLCFLCRM
ncbi:hypothetical protein GOODEAATRI_008154, partial [Goodea atripinnis]